MRIVLVLAIPLLLFSAWQYTRREENENRLALVASAVALREVDVSCPGFWTRLVEITPNSGWVAFDEHGRPSDETSLSASTCSSLERVWRGKQRAFGCLAAGACDQKTLDAVNGIVTLAHEAWHLRGIVNEAQTQCYAVQTVESVAHSLGVAAHDARAIAARVAAHDARAPEGEYHSSQCRPEGAVRPPPADPRVAQRLAALHEDAGPLVAREGRARAVRRRRRFPRRSPAAKAACSGAGAAPHVRSARSARRAGRRAGGSKAPRAALQWSRPATAGALRSGHAAAR